MTPVTVATCFARRSGRCAHAPWRPLRPALDFPEPRPGTFPSATCPVGNQTQRSPELQRRKQPPPGRVPWEDTTLAQVPRGAEVNTRRGVRASARGKHREEEGGGHRRPRPHTRAGGGGGWAGRLRRQSCPRGAGNAIGTLKPPSLFEVSSEEKGGGGRTVTVTETRHV